MPFESISDSQVESLLESNWGLRARSIQRLESERDDTFRVSAVAGEYLLKVSHPEDDPALIASQLQAMESLQNHPGVRVQRLIPDTLGAPSVQLVNSKRIARLLEYLPGEPIAGHVATEDQLVGIGQTAALVSAALSTLPTATFVTDTDWNLLNANRLLGYLEGLSGIADRGEIRADLEGLLELVMGRLAGLPRQVCHNDLNPGNLIRDPSESEVLGVVDFGDITVAPRVCELAVASSYASSLHEPSQGGYWRAAELVRKGFESKLKLSADESALFRPLVRLRLIQRLILNSAVAEARPTNQKYASRYVPQLIRAIRASRESKGETS